MSQPPSKEQFIAAFRARFLAFMAEAWAVRKESPSGFGLVMDAHLIHLRRLLGEVYDELVPKPEAPAGIQRHNGNGAHQAGRG